MGARPMVVVYTATTKLDSGTAHIPFAPYLRGALYFTKALKLSQLLVIDLTLRALTQPKTRAFTTANGSSLPA